MKQNFDDDEDEKKAKCCGYLGLKQGIICFLLIDVLILIGYIFLLAFDTNAITLLAVKIAIPVVIGPCIIMGVWALSNGKSTFISIYLYLNIIKLVFMMIFLPILMIRMNNQFFG